jgi:hypothetical protein
MHFDQVIEPDGMFCRFLGRNRECKSQYQRAKESNLPNDTFHFSLPCETASFKALGGTPDDVTIRDRIQ